jgi:dihydrofolate synthase/folylpolyglutamate synthase
LSYPESVRYLYALGNELKAGAKFGLERMTTLLAALGNPERGQRFVHVAGTNGKGSTSAMIASVLRAAGLNTGLYSSPHLVSPLERIQINGVAVSEAAFAGAFDEVHRVSEDLIASEAIDAHPSYFETVTAMAFLLFRERCDISVIEVGLGGRLDATNVIVPELCVITPVSFDHEAFLGNTIESIAFEKAGILKPNVPAIIAPQLPAAEAVIAKTGNCLIRSDTVQLENIQVTAESSTFLSNGTHFQCPLAGRHQIENARTAIAASRALGIADATIAAGLQNTAWPGRLEVIQRAPTFILDGAHNPSGAASLAAHIREFYTQFCTQKPVWLVYGAMRDKAIDEVTAQLFPLADRLILTAPNFPRALRPQFILDLHPHPNAVIAETLPEALEIAQSAPRDTTVFFTGSLFVVGEIKALTVK